MAKRTGSTNFQFMHVANALQAHGGFMDKREILEACDGTGIAEYRLSTYLWDCKKYGGVIRKEKIDGVPKWKLDAMPTPPDFNARKTAKSTVAKPKKAAKVVMTAAELVSLLTDETGVDGDAVANLQPMAVAAAKPATKAVRKRKEKSAETAPEPAAVTDSDDAVTVSDDDRTEELLAALA